MREYLDDLPLIAILRGITPAEAVPVGLALAEAGLRIVEVPLNSPQPLRSIEALSRELGERCLVGAGTVMSAAQVDAGGARRRAADRHAARRCSGHPRREGAVAVVRTRHRHARRRLRRTGGRCRCAEAVPGRTADARRW